MLLFTQFKHVWSELIFHLIAKILSIKNDAFNCNLYLTDWFACIWLLSDGDSYNIGGKMIMLLIFSIFDHRLVVTNKNCLQNHYRLWFIARDRSLGCEPFQEKMTYKFFAHLIQVFLLISNMVVKNHEMHLNHLYDQITDRIPQDILLSS